MANTTKNVDSQMPDTVEPKKKARPNPTRRRASKLKDRAIGPSEDGPLITSTLKAPSLQRRTTEPADPVRPPTSRQNSEPLPKQRTTPVAKARAKEVMKTAPTVSGRPPTFIDSRTQTDRQAVAPGPAITTGGLIGSAASAAVLFGVHLWYNFAGPEQAILVAKSARICVDNMTDEIITSQKAGTYSADEALDVLRRTTLTYASTIPGGIPAVERVFREVNLVRQQRGHEIDGVVSDTYIELTKATARNASAADMQKVVLMQLIKLSGFASRSIQDVVTRNPELKPYRDGAIKSLQGPPSPKVPTLQINMTVKQRLRDRT